MLFWNTCNSISAIMFDDFEWLIVDGSTEQDSICIVDSGFRSIGLKARLYRQADRNIAHAFNIGISNSLGEYILFLNSGDTYSPTFISKCDHQLISSNKSLAIICASTLCVAGNSSLAYTFTAKPSALWRGMHTPHCWMCVPRQIYDRVGLYSEIPHAMDYEWCKRVLKTYGSNIFCLLDDRRPQGTYLLGGHSDRYYFDGLLATKRINVYYGMPILVAYAIYLLYLSSALIKRCHFKKL